MDYAQHTHLIKWCVLTNGFKLLFFFYYSMTKIVVSALSNVDLKTIGFVPSNDRKAFRGIDYEIVSGYLAYLRNPQEGNLNQVLVMPVDLSQIDEKTLCKNANNVFYVSGCAPKETYRKTAHIIGDKRELLPNGLEEIVESVMAQGEHGNIATDLKYVIGDYFSKIAEKLEMTSHEGFMHPKSKSLV